MLGYSYQSSICTIRLDLGQGYDVRWDNSPDGRRDGRRDGRCDGRRDGRLDRLDGRRDGRRDGVRLRQTITIGVTIVRLPFLRYDGRYDSFQVPFEYPNACSSA